MCSDLIFGANEQTVLSKLWKGNKTPRYVLVHRYTEKVTSTFTENHVHSQLVQKIKDMLVKAPMKTYHHVQVSKATFCSGSSMALENFPV